VWPVEVLLFSTFSCCAAAGPVAKIRLLGDFQHSTRIAFIEFMSAEGAMAALNCSGALLGESAWKCTGKQETGEGQQGTELMAGCTAGLIMFLMI
jgi:hypothetical protein